MLEASRQEIEELVQQKIRGFRDTTTGETTRPPADLSDDASQEDLDFALVQMQAQTLENITAALARLHAGEYGICHECEEEIPAVRLRALPFATRCRSCQETVENVEQRDRRLRRQQGERPRIGAIGW